MPAALHMGGAYIYQEHMDVLRLMVVLQLLIMVNFGVKIPKIVTMGSHASRGAAGGSGCSRSFLDLDAPM